MAKPRGRDWLSDEMEALHSLGVDVVVSALPDVEAAELGLDAEQSEARAAGLAYVALPISDRAVPDLKTATPTLVQLAERLRVGEHIAVHCRFGIGRASLIAAALLVKNGTHPADAWQAIEKARGLPVPDTAAQRAWVQQFVR